MYSVGDIYDVDGKQYQVTDVTEQVYEDGSKVITVASKAV
ncbi:hypothetical protein PAAL109150_14550 [Paenibacillus alkaliterrae]